MRYFTSIEVISRNICTRCLSDSSVSVGAHRDAPLDQWYVLCQKSPERLVKQEGIEEGISKKEERM